MSLNTTVQAKTSFCDLIESSRCTFTATLAQIYPPVLLVIGTIGNVLSFVVWTRKRMRGTTCSFYLTCLSVSDLLVLYIGLIREYIIYLDMEDIRKISDTSCRIQMWSQFVPMACSTWILVAINFDRLIAVKFPLFSRTNCKYMTAAIVTSVIVIVSVLVGFHYFGMERREVYKFSATTNTTTLIHLRCEPGSPGYHSFYMKYWSPFLLLFYFIIPFIVIIVSCITMAIVMKGRMTSFYPETQVGNNLDASTKSLTRMLIAISICFLLALMPTCVYFVIEYKLFPEETPENIVNRKLLWICASFFFYGNSSFNFVIYCLSGSTFRKTLKDMLQQTYRRITNRATVAPTTTQRTYPS